MTLRSKHIIVASAIGAAASALAGCSQTEADAEATGSVRLLTRLNASVESVSVGSRSAADDVADHTKVWISGAAGLVRRYESLAEVPAAITLRADNYVAEVWAGDSVPASFTARYFTGSAPFTVTAGATTSVTVECPLAQVAASVEYAPEVDEVLTGYSLTVGHSGGSLTFQGRDDRRGYFMLAGADRTLHYELTGVKHDGTALSQKGEIRGVRRATDYHFRVERSSGTLDDGAAFFTVTVDTTTVDERTDVEVVLPPHIAGHDFDLAYPVQSEKGKFADVTLDIAAVGHLASLVLECPEAASILGGSGVDLLQGSNAATLAAKGISSSRAYNSRTDITSMCVTFTGSMINSLGDGEHTILITATDSGDRSTTAALTLTTIDAPVMAAEVPAASVWATKATLTGTVLQAAKATAPGFRYRAKGGEWKAVSARLSGSAFTAELSGLTPGTTYEVVATATDFISAVVRTFTTEEALTLPNGDFETWNTSQKAYLLAADDASRFWDTGNHGSATLNTNVTTPNSDLKHSGRYSARLASQFVGIMGIGKFAAGNAFVGQYLATDGTDGILGFGRPFTSRPTALKGYLRYEPAAVTYSTVNELPKGEQDRGCIYVAILADGAMESYGGSEFPFIIKTKSSEQRLFDRNDPRVIGFGELVLTRATDGSGLTAFTLPITYTDTTRKASHLVLVCTASYYGDYFTGGPSVMYIDDFSFSY